MLVCGLRRKSTFAVMTGPRPTSLKGVQFAFACIIYTRMINICLTGAHLHNYMDFSMGAVNVSIIVLSDKRTSTH